MPVTNQDYDALVQRMFAAPFGPALEHLVITSIEQDYSMSREVAYPGQSAGHHAIPQRRYTVKGQFRESAHVGGQLVPTVEELFGRYPTTLTFRDVLGRGHFRPLGTFEMQVTQPLSTQRVTPMADAALPEIVAAASAGDITDGEAVQALQALERMDGVSDKLDRLAFARVNMTRTDGELDDAFRSRISTALKELSNGRVQ